MVRRREEDHLSISGHAYLDRPDRHHDLGLAVSSQDYHRYLSACWHRVHLHAFGRSRFVFPRTKTIGFLLTRAVLTTINLHLKQEHVYERQDSPDLLLVHPAFRNDFKDLLSKGGIPRNFSIPRERCIDNKERTSPTLPNPASSAFVATGLNIKYEKKHAVGCRPLPTLPTTTKAVEAGEARSTVDHPLPPIPIIPTWPTIDIQGVDSELQNPEKSTHSLAPIIELQEATPTPEGHRHLIIDALPINRLTWTKSTTIRKVSDKLDVPVVSTRPPPVLRGSLNDPCF